MRPLFAILLPKKELGSSTVELVIVLAFLLPILLGSMYLAKMVHAYISLVSAAHAGARAGALILRDSESPQWHYDEDDSTITILHEADVENDMLEATQAAMDPDKYELVLVQPQIVCRCVKKTVAGVDVYGEFVACDNAAIAGCDVNASYPRTYRQIHARLNAQLTLALPFLPRETITLRASSTMQSAEVDS